MNTSTPTATQAAPPAAAPAIRLMFIIAVDKSVLKSEQFKTFRNAVEDKSIVDKIKLAINADRRVKLQQIESYLNLFVGVIEVVPGVITDTPGAASDWELPEDLVQTLLRAIFSWRDSEGSTSQSALEISLAYRTASGSSDQDETAALLTWSLVRLDKLCAGDSVSLLGKKGIGLQ